MELVRRAVSAPEGAPTASKATLFVTVSWEDLVAQLRAGAVVGSSDGGTLLAPGMLLAPGTVRRMACDAGIIPVVLGGDGQVLDLGREWRWFTPAQTRVLWLRDGACTIPGCGMPAQWCEAHHLWHFADGGPTDLAYAALLCGYHHHWVHIHRLAGRVVQGQVRWDVAEGSYDSYLREVRPDGPDGPAAPDPPPRS